MSLDSNYIQLHDNEFTNVDLESISLVSMGGDSSEGEITLDKRGMSPELIVLKYPTISLARLDWSAIITKLQAINPHGFNKK